MEPTLEHECDEHSFKLLNIRCRICGHKDVRLVLDFLSEKRIRWRISCACGRFEQRTMTRGQSLLYASVLFENNLAMIEMVADHLP